MHDSFDPYFEWLSIRDDEKPPNHYRLLGTDLFEDNVSVVANAADRQMAHVRRFQGGKHSEVSQKLLNELAAAKICLLNPAKKQQYDERLRKKLDIVDPEALIGDAHGSSEFAAIEGSDASAKLVDSTIDRDLPKGGVLVASNGSHRRGESAGGRDRHTRFSTVRVWALPAGCLVLAGILTWALWSSRANSVSPDDDDQGAVASSRDDAETNERDSLGHAPPSDMRDEGDNVPRETTESPPNSANDAVEESASTAPWDHPRRKNNAPARPAPALKIREPVLASLNRARAALSNREPAVALAALDDAAAVAELSDEETEVLRHRYLSDTLRGFWDAIPAETARLNAGDKFEFRNAPVTVVSVMDSEIVLRSENGVERAFSLERAELDPDLAVALVSIGLDLESPDSLAMLAVFELCDRDGCFENAAAWLEQIDGSHEGPKELTREMGFDFAALAPYHAPPTEKTFAAPVDDAATGPVATATKKRPRPSNQALAKAKEKIGTAYGASLDGMTPEEGTNLAQQLLRDAVRMSGEDDDAAQYMLLGLACKLATDAGDVELMLGVLDELDDRFEVDAPKLRESKLRELIAGAITKEQARSAATVAIDLADQAVNDEQFDLASKLADAAFAAAQKADDPGLVKELRARSQEIDDLERLFTRMQPYLEKLKDDPDDPTANLRVGHFYCFGKGDFDKGLPYLAKAGDSDLTPRAKRDLANPTKPQDRFEIAEDWWEYGQRRTSAVETKAKLRAVHWYQLALPELSTLDKRIAEKRIEEFLVGSTVAKKEKKPAKRDLNKYLTSQLFDVAWSDSSAWNSCRFLANGGFTATSTGQGPWGGPVRGTWTRRDNVVVTQARVGQWSRFTRTVTWVFDEDSGSAHFDSRFQGRVEGTVTPVGDPPAP
jgi:hypothetical protein